jgi:hypothetical protein
LQFFPKVAEIREQIADELAAELQRKADEWNRGASDRELLAAPIRKPPTPEEIAAVEAVVAEAKRAIAEGKASFADSTDLEEPPRRSMQEDLAGFRLLPPHDPKVLEAMRQAGIEPTPLPEAAE